jgi:hypothetical protein
MNRKTKYLSLGCFRKPEDINGDMRRRYRTPSLIHVNRCLLNLNKYILLCIIFSCCDTKIFKQFELLVIIAYTSEKAAHFGGIYLPHL